MVFTIFVFMTTDFVDNAAKAGVDENRLPRIRKRLDGQ